MFSLYTLLDMFSFKNMFSIYLPNQHCSGNHRHYFSYIISTQELKWEVSIHGPHRITLCATGAVPHPTFKPLKYMIWLIKTYWAESGCGYRNCDSSTWNAEAGGLNFSYTVATVPHALGVFIHLRLIRTPWDGAKISFILQKRVLGLTGRHVPQIIRSWLRIQA